MLGRIRHIINLRFHEHDKICLPWKRNLLFRLMSVCSSAA